MRRQWLIWKIANKARINVRRQPEWAENKKNIENICNIENLCSPTEKFPEDRLNADLVRVTCVIAETKGIKTTNKNNIQTKPRERKRKIYEWWWIRL